MFALWNDLYGNGITVHDVHLRIMPVLQAMAVKCWTGQLTTVPYDTFEAQCKELGEAPGVNESGCVPNLPVKISDLQPNKTLSLPVHEVATATKYRSASTASLSRKAPSSQQDQMPRSTYPIPSAGSWASSVRPTSTISTMRCRRKGM